MAKEFEHEHSDIQENNVPLGWGLKLVILGVFHLAMFYGYFNFHKDDVSRDAPSTTVPHSSVDAEWPVDEELRAH